MVVLGVKRVFSVTLTGSAVVNAVRSTKRFGRVLRNRFSCERDMAPCGWSTLCSERETKGIWPYLCRIH